MRWKDQLLFGSMYLKPLRGVTNNGNGAGCALGMLNVSGCCAQNLFQAQAYTDRILPCGCDRSTQLMWHGGWMHQSALYRIPIDMVVIHLFNQHVCATEDEIRDGIEKWSIKQLADWLDTVQPPDPEDPNKEPEPEPDPDTEPVEEPVMV